MRDVHRFRGTGVVEVASELTRVAGCDLCRAVRMTHWYHEDEVCWIAECDVCDVPMVVWRWHGKTPPPEHLEHMRAHLHDVPWTGDRNSAIKELGDGVRAQGRRPL